ncbi:MAG TPA: OsmC family protein [Chitinophagaceae bacterium]|jgi:putative redox protein|nr:OsmC family protein [Chitinophagaceae bacterium]HMU59238.1 OsmC family protein [Chitinophagaceae bacterium]
MTKTITRWIKEHEFTSELEGNTINLDGARLNGFGPKALLLSGLAGCSGIDVVDILEKMRVEFSDFEIDVEADQTEEHPKVYKEISITYRIKTDIINEEKVRKAIGLSLEKYCGVAAMLRKNSPIDYKLEIVK